MTDTFTASNGIPVAPRENSNGYNFHPDLDMGTLTGISQDRADALREFFQRERDEELGRWRSKKYPDYVAYVKGDGLVIAVNEKSGRNLEVARPATREILGTAPILWRVVSEYVATHPEPKPWHEAKPGEVWILTIRNELGAFRRTEEGWNGLDRLTGNYFIIGDYITDGRRIWPEVSK